MLPHAVFVIFYIWVQWLNTRNRYQSVPVAHMLGFIVVRSVAEGMWLVVVRKFEVLRDVPSETMVSEVNPNTIEELLCTEEEVLQLLQTIDISSSSSPELKLTAVSIAAPVTKLFNFFILSGTFPAKWKLSSVVPIPKSSDKGSPKNYCPISLLPILSKLLEDHVYGLLLQLLNQLSNMMEEQVKSNSVHFCSQQFSWHGKVVGVLQKHRLVRWNSFEGPCFFSNVHPLLGGVDSLMFMLSQLGTTEIMISR